jgi:hypothetical protein
MFDENVIDFTDEHGGWAKIEALYPVGVNPMNGKQQYMRIDAWKLVKPKEAQPPKPTGNPYERPL